MPPDVERVRGTYASPTRRVIRTAALTLVLAVLGLSRHPLVASAETPGTAIPAAAMATTSASLSTTSVPFADARDRLPARFQQYESRRFVVLTDVDLDRARAQLERLERAHHQFQRFCRKLRLDPQPLRHKLVCVLFQDRAAYRDFASRHDDITAEWIAGYYAPRSDRIVFYDASTNPSVADARRSIASMTAELRKLEDEVADARRSGDAGYADRLAQAKLDYARQIEDYEEHVDEFARQVGVSTTIHEAIHQLAFHTQVQSPFVQYPIWISEGLATAFETDAPNEAFGPERRFDVRCEQFDVALGDGSLLPLAVLVSLDRITDPADIEVIYAQSYALVTWLAQRESKALGAYMRSMLDEPRGRPNRGRHLELFEAAFGAVDDLERRWRRDMRAQAARR